MEKEEARGILITHNRWRMGEDVDPVNSSLDIGEAIDVAIEALIAPTPDLLKEAREEADILSAQGKYADLNNEQVFIKGAQFIINKLNERKKYNA